MRTILSLGILGWLVSVLVRYWQAGALSTASFVILGITAAFEIGILWGLLFGFQTFWDDPDHIDKRRAAVRAPKKRFG